jgi:hypothetical protein
MLAYELGMPHPVRHSRSSPHFSQTQGGHQLLRSDIIQATTVLRSQSEWTVHTAAPPTRKPNAGAQKALPQNSQFDSPFEANANSAPKINLTGWTGLRRG